MASRRMISTTVFSSDRFMDLQPVTQLLYLQIGLNADDDGFTNRINVIRRMVGAKKENVNELVDAGFIYIFESGVTVDMFWNVNNSVRKDRYKPTVYQDEYQRLTLVDGGKYALKPDGEVASAECQPSDNQMDANGTPSDNQMDTDGTPSDNQMDTDNQMDANGTPSDNQMDTEVRLGKVSIDNPSNIQSESNNNSAINNNIYISNELVDNSNKSVDNSKVTSDENAQQGPDNLQPPSLDGVDVYELTSRDAFEMFRQKYPRRQGALRDVQTAWVTATVTDHIIPGDLVRAAERYAEECKANGTEQKYIKMPQNFISSGAWKQYIPKYLPSCPYCHGQGVYEDNGMVLCDCDRRYG